MNAKKQTSFYSCMVLQTRRKKLICSKAHQHCKKKQSHTRISEKRAGMNAWFYTIDGLLAIGGRDSSSNMAMIRKHVEKDDYVFHADIHGSPFFILKNAQNATDASIMEVARATVCFSRAWRETMFGLSALSRSGRKKCPKRSVSSKRIVYIHVSTLRLAICITFYSTIVS